MIYDENLFLRVFWEMDGSNGESLEIDGLYYEVVERTLANIRGKTEV